MSRQQLGLFSPGPCRTEGILLCALRQLVGCMDSPVSGTEVLSRILFLALTEQSSFTFQNHWEIMVHIQQEIAFLFMYEIFFVFETSGFVFL